MARIYKAKDGDTCVQLTEREYKVLRATLWSATNNMETDLNVQDEYEQNLKYFGLIPRDCEPSTKQLKQSYRYLIDSLV